VTKASGGIEVEAPLILKIRTKRVSFMSRPLVVESVCARSVGGMAVEAPLILKLRATWMVNVSVLCFGCFIREGQLQYRLNRRG
jgi:hypothetical protein